jgi:hypothetical protein
VTERINVDKVRLHLNNYKDIKLIIQDSSFINEKADVEIVSAWDEESEDANVPATLKDISIIMYTMVGCGVQHQLASELSDYLRIGNPKRIDDILSIIFEKYRNLSDEEAYERFNSLKKLL